jgi:RNA polymerase sigma factor (sigma-70 family)
MQKEESDHVTKQREDFDANYTRYRKELGYIVLRNVRNKADAEEICDETIVNFLKSMERRGWPKIENILGYLVRSAKRTAMKRARRHSKEVSITDHGDEQSKGVGKSLDEKAVRENDPTNRYQDALRSGEVLQHMRETILSDLSDEEWDLLNLHHVEQMKAIEIAESLNMDVYRVRYQINKLSAKIRYRARQFRKRAANS